MTANKKTDVSVSSVMPPPETQKLWFNLRNQRPWRSLALVPANDSVDIRLLAEDFARLAALGTGHRVLFIDATGEPVADSLRKHPQIEVLSNAGMTEEALLTEFLPKVESRIVASRSEAGTTIFAVRSLSQHMGGLALVRFSSAWVLGVRLGDTRFSEAAATIDLLDRETLLGAVVIDVG
jgi:hypothetical protein